MTRIQGRRRTTDSGRIGGVWTGGTTKIKEDYIHDNVVRRGLVAHPEDWAHASYRQIQMGQRAVPFM